MTVVSFNAAYEARHGTEPQVWVKKARVAAHYGMSTRWVELRVREGAPCRWDSPKERYRLFDLQAFDAWLKARAA